jgi:hypothetical protein
MKSGRAALLLLLVLLVPLDAEAQRAGKVARLGVLLFGTLATDPNLAALVAALHDLKVMSRAGTSRSNIEVPRAARNASTNLVSKSYR